MISLDDNKWKELEGGYHILYDASVPLKRLAQAITDEETEAVFTELRSSKLFPSPGSCPTNRNHFP